VKVVIPMSGLSSRFTDAGYTIPKHLIEIDGKRHQSWVYKIYPQAEVYYEDPQGNHALHRGRYPGNYGLMQWNERLWNDY